MSDNLYWFNIAVSAFCILSSTIHANDLLLYGGIIYGLLNIYLLFRNERKG
jgi:hypothetical protein